MAYRQGGNASEGSEWWRTSQVSAGSSGSFQQTYDVEGLGWTPAVPQGDWSPAWPAEGVGHDPAFMPGVGAVPFRPFRSVPRNGTGNGTG